MSSNKIYIPPIYFGDSAYYQLEKYLNYKNFSKIAIIVDNNTKTLCLPFFMNKIKKVHDFIVIETKSGEEYKSIKSSVKIWKNLIKCELDRKSLIINLGGGLITDIGAFAASTFKRGIEFINIPTTLLGMVDAAHGGKNGIDFDNLKNMIGTNNFPKMILIDYKFLKTLPENEFKSGMAEMFKHGLISDKTHWNELKSLSYQNQANLPKLVKKSLEIKNSIVRIDPFEKNLRKYLNFGHTLGHAIETFALKQNRFNKILHGEAIAVGMILEAYISTKKLKLPKKDVVEIKSTLRKNYSILDFKQKDIEKIISLLIHDKKNNNGIVKFTLLNKIGSCSIDLGVEEKIIHEAFIFYAT